MTAHKSTNVKQIVIFSGGRGFNNLAQIESELDLLNPDLHIIAHGNAPGLDRLAGEAAKRKGFEIREFPADWEGPCRDTCKAGHRRQRRSGGDYCPAAGVFRNQEMLDSGAQMLVSFPGGTGTKDMRDRARLARIAVIVPRLEQ